MEILAEYSNSTSKKITKYTYSPSDSLKVDDNKIIISYTEEGISQKAELEIEVNNIPEKNDSMSIVGVENFKSFLPQLFQYKLMF